MKDLSVLTATKILNATTVNHGIKRSLEVKNRKSFGVSFALSGQLIYHHNGKKYISKENRVVFFPKGASYTIECQQKGVFTLIDFETDEPSAFSEFMSVGITPDPAFLHDHTELEKLFLFKNPDLHAHSLSLFYSILSKVISNSDKLGLYPTLRPAVEYMQNNIGSADISNKLLAEKANISVVYFRKLFKECYGISPGQYMLKIKIDKAKQLLKTGTLTVTEISAKCGYSNVYHFCEIFKKKTGMTPTEYRKKKRHLYL